ncbi:MAG: hypothetical protein C3F06_07385 [Candidatus Methanoperedenaceae archaeon]|nr:MAG: hypothetical protein C3F06_07385 [Candidatus Methanoperedenaceae archaeon]
MLEKRLTCLRNKVQELKELKMQKTTKVAVLILTAAIILSGYILSQLFFMFEFSWTDAHA